MGAGRAAEEEVKTPDCPPELPSFFHLQGSEMNKQLPLTGDVEA